MQKILFLISLSLGAHTIWATDISINKAASTRNFLYSDDADMQFLETLINLELKDPREDPQFKNQKKQVLDWTYWQAAADYSKLFTHVIEQLDKLSARFNCEATKINLQLLKNQCANALKSLKESNKSSWSDYYDGYQKLREQNINSFALIKTAFKSRKTKTESEIFKLIDAIEERNRDYFSKEQRENLQKIEASLQRTNKELEQQNEMLAKISAEKIAEESRLAKLRNEYNDLEERMRQKKLAYEKAYEIAFKNLEMKSMAGQESDTIEIKCNDLCREYKKDFKESVIKIANKKLAIIRGNNADIWPKVSIYVGIKDHAENLFAHDRVSLVVFVSAHELSEPCATRIDEQEISSTGTLISDGLSVFLGSCLPKILVEAKKEREKISAIRHEANSIALENCQK